MMGTQNLLQSWSLSMDSKLLSPLKTVSKDLEDGRLSLLFFVYLHFKDFFQYILGGFDLNVCVVQNSGLPWLTPKSPLSIGSLTDAIAGALGVCISISVHFSTYEWLQ